MESVSSSGSGATPVTATAKPGPPSSTSSNGRTQDVSSSTQQSPSSSSSLSSSRVSSSTSNLSSSGGQLSSSQQSQSNRFNPSSSSDDQLPNHSSTSSSGDGGNHGRFSILRTNSRSGVGSPPLFTMTMPIASGVSSQDVVGIPSASEVYTLSSDPRSSTVESEKGLRSSGTGGGGGGGGPLDDMHSNGYTAGADSRSDNPRSSFEMFQRQPGAFRSRVDSNSQIFRFDSNPSTSFVRTFYRDSSGQVLSADMSDPQSDHSSSSTTVAGGSSSAQSLRAGSRSQNLMQNSSLRPPQPQSQRGGGGGTNSQTQLSLASQPPSSSSDPLTPTPSSRSTQQQSPSSPSSPISSRQVQVHGESAGGGQNSVILSSSSNAGGGEGNQMLLNSAMNSGCGHQYVDITEYLNMPQYVAARKLGIPASTLSKRWKEAVRTRKWPYRSVQKLDKEITTLLHNVPQGPDAPPLPKDIEQTLGMLLRKRQEELNPVIVRI